MVALLTRSWTHPWRPTDQILDPPMAALLTRPWIHPCPPEQFLDPPLDVVLVRVRSCGLIISSDRPGSAASETMQKLMRLENHCAENFRNTELGGGRGQSFQNFSLLEDRSRTVRTTGWAWGS